jgi:hypothetical protein
MELVIDPQVSWFGMVLMRMHCAAVLNQKVKCYRGAAEFNHRHVASSYLVVGGAKG